MVTEKAGEIFELYDQWVSLYITLVIFLVFIIIVNIRSYTQSVLSTLFVCEQTSRILIFIF